MSQPQNTSTFVQHKQLLWFTLAIVTAVTAAIVISLALMSYIVKAQVSAVLAAQSTQSRILPAATLTQATEQEIGPSCEPAPAVVANNLTSATAPSSTSPSMNRWMADNSTHNSTVDTRSVNNSFTSTFFDNSFNNSLNNTDSNNHGSNNTASGDITQTNSNNTSTTNTTDVSGNGNNINGPSAPVIPIVPAAPANPMITPVDPLPAIVD